MTQVNDDLESNNHFAHCMKLLDLFETRQTWTFNFAVGLYGFAFAAGGSLLEKVILPAFARPGDIEARVGIAAIVSAYSIALPLLMLPICYLFIDVSIYCAALGAGNHKFEMLRGRRESEPAVEAYRWIHDNKLQLHNYGNRRLYLFFWSPGAGFLASLLSLIFSVHHWWPWLIALSIAGMIISGTSLFLTIAAYQNACIAREVSCRQIEECITHLPEHLRHTTRLPPHLRDT